MIDKIIYFFGLLGILLTTTIIFGCLWFWNRMWFQITTEQITERLAQTRDKLAYWILDRAIGKGE